MFLCLPGAYNAIVHPFSPCTSEKKTNSLPVLCCPTLDMTATDIDVSLAEKFQFEDADVIIRAGGANFSAHKLILSLASPVFKHIFSLPRNESSQEGVPIVEVTEDAQSIHDVLSLLYPNIDDPNISDLIVMHRVLLALRKYEMLKLKARMARRLERAAWGKSARIFAIACHAGLADTARAAAQGTLLLERNTLITSVIPENKNLSAETFQKLLRYHIKCGEVAQAQAEAQASVAQNVAHSDWLWLRCRSDECPAGSCSLTVTLSKSRGVPTLGAVFPKQWWLDYLDDLREKLKVRPLSVNFTHRDLLQNCCRSASKCPECGPGAMFELMKFAETLEMRVRVEVGKVQLELNDDDFMI